MPQKAPHLRVWLLLVALLSPAAHATKLTVAAYPAVDEIVKASIPAWKALHPDVEIEVVSREFSDHHTAMTTSLATRSHLPDVMVLEASYLGRFASSGGLQDLSQPPFNASTLRERFVPYAFAQATTTNGSLVALPGDIGPGTMFYRKDLLRRSGVTEAQLTKSWNDFVDSGIKIKAACNAYLVADARDIKDAVIRSGLSEGQGLYFDAQGHVLVDGPRFQRAFELALKVRQAKLDGNMKAWSSEWTESLRSGRVATQMMGAWLGGHLAHWLAPNTSGLWRASGLPERTFIAWGGTFYAIPTRAAHPELAYEFIKLLTVDRGRQLEAFRAQDAFPALLEAQRDPFFEQPVEFLGGEQARKLWRETALKIHALPVNKLDPIAAEIVDTALDKVLNDNMPIPKALAEARSILEYRLRRP